MQSCHTQLCSILSFLFVSYFGGTGVSLFEAEGTRNVRSPYLTSPHWGGTQSAAEPLPSGGRTGGGLSRLYLFSHTRTSVAPYLRKEEKGSKTASFSS